MAASVNLKSLVHQLFVVPASASQEALAVLQKANELGICRKEAIESMDEDTRHYFLGLVAVLSNSKAGWEKVREAQQGYAVMEKRAIAAEAKVQLQKSLLSI